ncbi:MAG: FtsW/RodA/SpoVE family cell cycle protein [Alphaproteobacteria bacterium]|nr:FtsW/RodA/SpoVE family cell cycle protein [Alphaproteobacteria bacterium]
MVSLFQETFKENIPNLTDIKDTVIKRTSGDKYIWGIVFILALISILVVYSATGSLAYIKFQGNTNVYLKNQFIFCLLGLGIVFVVHRLNYIIWSKFAFLLFVFSIALLIYTQFWGIKLNEGSRWVKIPFLHFTIQTSDIAKLFLYIYISKLLSKNQESLNDFKNGYLNLLIPVIIICFLISLSNLSNACITFGSCMILFVIGRVKFKFILTTLLIALIPLIILILMAKSKHDNNQSTSFNNPVFSRLNIWVNRIESYLYPKDNTEQYQVVQAKIAIANGGLLMGLGPGNSQQRNFLPQAYNDFVFAIIIEEYGILGGVILMFLYLTLLYRCLLIVQRCKYILGTFLVLTLSFTIVFQALANIMVCVDLFPVTGVTLPLVSLGGSSFMITCIAIGIILSVDRFNDQEDNLEKIPTKSKNEN